MGVNIALVLATQIGTRAIFQTVNLTIGDGLQGKGATPSYFIDN